MEELEARVLAAGRDRQAMEELVRDYLPFLKKQAAQGGPCLDYDDRLSLSMVAFAEAVRRYAPPRGAFLPFAEVCIRNRRLDESRRELRHAGNVVPLREGERAVGDVWDRELERQALAQEIQQFDRDLALCGVTFAELPQACPRQRRARTQCLRLAACVAADEALRAGFRRTGRLPQGELARRFGLSVKTVEKHRKYIAALAVLLTGDHPGIRAFLPKGEAAE